MSLPVVVMAGGRGTRFGKGEKPLAIVRGRSLLARVMDSVEAAGFKDIFVAVSPWTPGTTERARRRGFQLIRTEGKGYVEDLSWINNQIPRFISVVADIPYLPAAELRRFTEVAERATSGVTGLLPDSRRISGPTPGLAWPEPVLPYGTCRVAGINRVDVSDPTPGHVFVFEDPWVGVSVTTEADLEWANLHAP